MPNQLNALRYCSYLLRCWEEQVSSDNAESVWRFSLEDAHTGMRQGFASLEALKEFLLDRSGCDDGVFQLRDDGVMFDTLGAPD